MTQPKLSDAQVTGLIRAALRRRFDDRARYCFLEEVGNATGYRNVGWADAFAFHLWPSDGLRFDGFEIKASKGDWKKELANPRKSENVARYCDGWIVVAPKGLIVTDTVPDGWGLWEYDVAKDSLQTRRAPARRPQPKYIPRHFFASLLRRTQETLPSVEYISRFHSEAQRAARREFERQLRASDKTIEERDADVARRRDDFDKAALLLRSIGYEWDYYRREFKQRAAI